ncbi:unnamed protein product, partial [Tetraodon nigroviridis]
MGLNDSSPGAMRNGRGLSDQWAESVVVRPRTTERRITVHKRLVLGFAVSILTLIVVTAVAVALSVRFEDCAARDRGGAAGSRGGGGTAKLNGSRGDRTADEDTPQPWRRSRLPGTVRPRHYDLQLVVHMDNFTFSGDVSIELECVHATRVIVLHANGLEVDRVSVTLEGGAGGRPVNRPGGGAMRINRHFQYAANQMHVVVLHREMKPARLYRLNMSFDAAIEDELLGFFRSSYTLQRERRYLAVTQFSPVHARKAFPCFDEPIYKATFSLSLRHDAQYTSLSNMPVDSSSPVDEDGWVTERFARTPRMSTYYLAWAVCNFTYRETRAESGVAIRLYARPNAIASGAGDYALHITKRLLGFYQDYFKVQYSLPKLGDISSRCRFILIFVETINQSGLTLRTAKSDESGPHVFQSPKRDIQKKEEGRWGSDLLAVPKHPYAAMENWGLSVFVEQKILLDPEVSSSSYQMELTMVVVHEICHQWFGDLVTPVWWEDVWLKEGFAHFFEYVGTDFLFPKWNMEKQRFLTDVLHEVMLLDGLSSSHPISQEVERATDIDRVFDWIAYKKGAALIRMLANVMGQSLFQKGLNDYLLSHMYANAARDDLWSKLSQAMRSEGRDIDIGGMMDRWTLQMGYPVVTVSKNQSEQLLTHYISVSQEHFLYGQEVGNNYSSLWQVPLTVAMGNASAVGLETLIWINNQTETHRIGEMDDNTWLLGNINQTGYFRVNYDLQNWKLLIQQLHDNHEIISVGNRAGLIDDAFNLARELQRELIMLACSFGNKQCHRQAVAYISDWISSNKNRIPPNIRDIVYCTGVSLMDEDVWEFIWMKFHSSQAVSEKKILLEALTCSDNVFLLNRLLNLSLTSDLVPEQDVIDVIIHVGRNPQGRNLAWRYFREKWEVLNARYGEALFMNSKLIGGVTEFLTTERELQELKDFIQASGVGAGPAWPRALEIVEGNVRWHRLHRRQFYQWLRKP